MTIDLFGRSHEMEGVPIRQTWATPQHLFNGLHKRFRFEHDLAACSWNSKCDSFYTVVDDALAMDWADGRRYWCNPPYEDIGPWVRKAAESVQGTATEVTLLLPLRTALPWFVDYVAPGRWTCWWTFNRRVAFIPPPGVEASSPAHESMLVQFADGGEGYGGVLCASTGAGV